MRPHLKLYPPPTPAEIDPPDDDPEAAEFGPDVGVRLRDLLPLVAMAQRFHFVWLKDFLDEEVRISTDLHDVLMMCGSGAWFEQLRQVMPPRSLDESLRALIALDLIEPLDQLAFA